MISIVLVQQDDSLHLVAPTSLGGDDDGCLTKFTPAKRKLDSEFLECQMGSSSGMRADADLEGVDDVKQVTALVAVKIEKE